MTLGERSACLVLSTLILAGCGRGDETQTIPTTRVVDAPMRPAKAMATSAERFGMRLPSSNQAPPSAGPKLDPLQWSVPEGWTAKPPRPMQLIGFEVGGDPTAECTVTVLGGAGGGLKANLDRWRGQFGLPELSEAELSALPTLTVLGTPTPVIDVTGSYQGQDGQRLLGAICAQPGRAVFVKMTGPASTIEAERERFRTFCESLH